MKKWGILLIFVAIACQDNEADAPELFPDNAQQIGATSVVMGAEIKEIGPVRPVNFGFLWDTQSDLSVINSKNKIVLGSTSEARKFSIKLDNLTPATTYFYRGFAANADYSKIYYSSIVSFTTLP
ncbi:MAG: fibronectin type III domain-containing protein [Cyclobacteriaceae bacterium]|nr:fibronectin type III domain-containing protein [Cyclobacteriaceae bacterium]